METKLVTWNINGLNSPQKWKKVFYWLNKGNYSVTCLQEVHIKQSDQKYIKNNKLGLELTSLAKTKKRGIVIYVKKELQPKKVLQDKEGRYLALEILLGGKKTLVLGVYAPNGPKEVFFTKLKQKIDQENYDHMIMMGDFNGVINPQIDKQPNKKRGKLPKIFTELTEQEHLVDIWREWNTNKKNFTYYSPSKKAFSRIDMLWNIKESSSVDFKK